MFSNIMYTEFLAHFTVNLTGFPYSARYYVCANIFKRLSGRQKAQAKGKREQQKTVLPQFVIRKGIFEILLGSFSLPESKHRGRKYLHCPDPHPRGAE